MLTGCLLVYSAVGMMFFWTLFEYGQLVAVMPLMTSRFMPWTYEAFKPFFVTHLIFGYTSAWNENSDPDDFYNMHFRACGITVNSLVYNTALLWFLVLIVLIICDIASHLWYVSIRSEPEIPPP